MSLTITFEHKDELKGNCAWSVLKGEHIFDNLHNFVIATKYSIIIDSLTKLGLSTSQIYSHFQELGINVYEEQTY